MTQIALVGPGAIGGTLAAWLAQNPQLSVTVAARTAFDQLSVEAPYGPLSVKLRVITDPAQGSPMDWVLVATKAYDSASASPWLAKLLGPQTRVAVVQNGVEHVERFAPYVPVDRIVPVMIDLPAERTAPGKIRQ